ncbi:MAG: hypothetical protein AAFX87_01770 [Bacteroidota bacterium]
MRIITNNRGKNKLKQILILILLLLSTLAYGQEGQAVDSLAKRVKIRLSMQININSDSIGVVDRAFGQVDSANALLTYRLDSISELKIRNHKSDSLKQATRQKLDSIKMLNLPHEKYVAKVDSLNSRLEGKISELNQKAEQKLQDWRTKLTAKLNGADSLGNVNLPDTRLQNSNIDLTNVDEQLNIDKPAGLDNLELKGMEDVDIDANIENPLESNEKLRQIKSEADRIKGVPQEEIEKVKSSGEVKGVTDELGKVKEVGAEVDEYNQAIAKAKEGDVEDLEKKTEEEALKRSELNMLNEETAEFNKLKEQHGKFLKDAEQYQNKEMVIQRIKEKSKHLAINHLPKNVDYQSKLEAAQKRLAAYKKKYGEIQSLEDTLLKKTNPLKGKPLKERLRPGFDLEIARSGNPFIDFAPTLGYRINDRWSIYGSYVYRFEFKQDEFALAGKMPTHGGRFYSTYRVFKSFSLLAGGDYIRTNVPRTQTGENYRAWAAGLYGGIVKRYSLSRTLKGTAQALYNFNHDDNSPFPRKFNIRLGFELDLSKKRKKQRLDLNGKPLPKGVKLPRRLR